MNDTNRICEQYISQIKAFFPIMGKREKDYLQNLKSVLNDYCQQSTAISMCSLYDEFGTPSSIVADYFSDSNINNTVERIRKDKSLKLVSAFLLTCLMIVLIGCCIKTRQYIFKHNQAIIEDVYYYEEEIK